MHTSRICIDCGKSHGKLDSLRCWSCRRKTIEPNCKCVICGNLFHEIPARIRDGRGKYCSRKCRSTAEWIDLKCKRCGKEFKRRKSWIKNLDRLGLGSYCSRKCQIPYSKGKKMLYGEEWLKHTREASLRRKGIPLLKARGPRNLSDESRAKMRAHRLSQTFLKQDTDIEILMKNALDNTGIKYEHPYQFGYFMCDFAVPEKKLIIECDGIYWHSLARNKHFDERKECYCKESGWNILRFTDKNIKMEMDYCMDEIQKCL